MTGSDSKLRVFANWLRKLDADVEDVSIAEVLWLAQRIRQPATEAQPLDAPTRDEQTPATGPEPQQPPQQDAADRRAEARQDDANDNQEQPEREDDAGEGSRFSRAGDEGAATQTQFFAAWKGRHGGHALSASTIRLPAVAALPEALAIGRALRPLSRKFQSLSHCELDEEATAESIARTQRKIYVPVYRPAPERWVQLALVVEKTPSLDVWQQTIIELRRLLIHSGVFSDVRLWSLQADGQEPVVYSATGVPHDPRELLQTAGRHLFLVVSDCVSEAWRTGSIPGLLADWSKTTPLAVAQVLPREMWFRTWLGEPVASLSALRAGLPNDQLRVERPRADVEERQADVVATPAFALEPAAIREWARTLMGAGGAAAEGVLLSSRVRGELRPVDPGDGVASGERRVSRFRAMASPEAFRLATFLSVSSLTMPVMRLIQFTMLPNSPTSILAEVLLGGILERQQSAGEVAPSPDEVVYDFQPGVRDALQSLIRRREARRVMKCVSQFVRDRWGDPFDFIALTPDAAGDETLPAEALPFATVVRELRTKLQSPLPTAAAEDMTPATPTSDDAPVGQYQQLRDTNVTLADGQITIKGHPSLGAEIRLGPRAVLSEATRNSFRTLERPWMQMLLFSDKQGESLAVLELSNFQNADSMQDTPLTIWLDAELRDGEYIVPLLYDGEDFLLVGEPSKDESGKTRIDIRHLPDISYAGPGQSVGGNLELCFFKTQVEPVESGRLSWVEFTAVKRFERHSAGVQEKVASAKKILLLVHGIFGDLQEMAHGLGRARDTNGMSVEQQFDLILTYDYDAPIELAARQLYQELYNLGLGAGSGKHLTLLADSTGGLVARWLIELEGGNQFVEHLVMVGVPNNGSPFGDVAVARQLTSLLTSVAINTGPAFTPYCAALLSRIVRSQDIARTLEQIDPQSDFIKQLNESPDPGVRYTIVAGNVRGDGQERVLRLMGKVAGELVSHPVYRTANDIVATTESILNVPAERAPSPTKIDVDCHHLNYFSSKSGLDALSQIRWGETQELNAQSEIQFGEAAKPVRETIDRPASAYAGEEFESFVLRISASLRPSEGSQQMYDITAVSSSWRASEMEGAVLDDSGLQRILEATREVWRSASEPDRGRDESWIRERVEQIGRELFESFFPPNLRRYYLECRAKAQSLDRKLRVRLWLDASELAALPWELLYDKEQSEYIALNREILLVRDVDRPGLTRSPLPPLRPPLRILCMFAVEPERRLLQEALRPLLNAGMASITWVERNSVQDLARALRQESFDVFHYVGHGGVDERGERWLAFEGEAGNTDRVGTERFAHLLIDHTSLRLVVLQTWLATSSRNEFGLLPPVGEDLVRSGIPAVVSMYDALTDRSSQEFSRRFYNSLAEGRPVDLAVSEARSAVHILAPETLDWASPVLHTSGGEEVFSADSARSSEAQADHNQSAAPSAKDTPAADESSTDPVAVDRNRQVLLRKVKRTWIEGVLEKSLGNGSVIDLGMQTAPEATESLRRRRRSETEPRSVQNIEDVFEQFGGSLLILGSPGSGKTTLLLTLVRELIAHAESDPSSPVPVVLSLSSWTRKTKSLSDWLIKEAASRYKVSRRLASAWLEEDRLGLFLDDLDIVGDKLRAKCVREISLYTKERSPPVAVCCRLEEYTEMSERLVVNGAIRIQPLSNDQISKHLLKLSGTEAVRLLLLEDESLRELAQTPLLLSMMIREFLGVSPDAVYAGSKDIEERKRRLMNAAAQLVSRSKDSEE